MVHEMGGTRPWAFFNVAPAANILREAAAAVSAPRGEVLKRARAGGRGRRGRATGARRASPSCENSRRGDRASRSIYFA